MKYFNLHSHFSPLGGLASPEDLIDCLLLNGQREMALTDTNGFYGIPEFLKVCQQKEVKGVIGCEVRSLNYQFIILVKNRKGFEGTCRFLSKWHELDYQKKELPFKDVCLFLDDVKDDIKITSFNKNVINEFSFRGFKSLYFEMSEGFFLHNDVLWAQRNNIKTVVNNKIHYLFQEQSLSYQVLRSIAHNTSLLENHNIPFHHPSCYFKSVDYFYKKYAHYDEALWEAEHILDDCSADWFFEGLISPGFNGLTENECSQKLKEQCLSNIPHRYRDHAELQSKAYERLQYEMNIIHYKNFSSYFLNVKDIVSQCDYTCGRGSSAASLVNYLLEITHVDPIRENLLFDRFMNKDREDAPDIDVDFPSDQRDDVLEYIFKSYPGHAAMVANHNFLGGRSALREVAKVFGIKHDEINYTLDRLGQIELYGIWLKVLELAKQIEGVLNHLSVHCAGVVITPKPIHYYGATQLSQKGYPVLQWEKDQTELVGLIKTDILGNKGLSVIRDTIQTVNRRGKIQLDYKTLPALGDQKAEKVFKEGKTIGVIHFESPRCRTLLESFNDETLKTLSIICSIIRPAASHQVSEILRRFKGGRFSYAHPELENILSDTYGIMVYQEDVMRVAKALAGFSSQEGNELRKALSKKGKKLSYYQDKFYKGCQLSGMTNSQIDILWEDIISFAGYSFCKPHSDSYSLVAYKSAFLKAYYPAEFMASVISQGGGFYVGNIEHYLNEARRMGVTIMPPDINLSSMEYQGEHLDIRVGLNQIKGVSKALFKRILSERELGLFTGLEDFLERVSPSFVEAKILVKARVFGSIRKTNKSKVNHSELMWRVYQFFARKNGHIGQEENLPILRKEIPEMSHQKLICWEYEGLNGFVTFPSWFLYRDLLKNRQIVVGKELVRYIDQEVIVYGQKVSVKRVTTKRQEAMAFITFSDDSGMYNTVLFPREYNEFRDILFLGGSFLIKGKVEQDFKGAQITVSNIQRIGEI